jgi:hypothetical protein
MIDKSHWEEWRRIISELYLIKNEKERRRRRRRRRKRRRKRKRVRKNRKFVYPNCLLRSGSEVMKAAILFN